MTRPYRPSLPFWAYSSFNKRGGKSVPIVIRRMNQALDMWAMWSTREQIAEKLEISIDAVDDYIRRARRRGDPRAVRPLRDRKALQAKVRKRQIHDLFATGMAPSEIASRLGVHVRLVQMRLKETAEAAE